MIDETKSPKRQHNIIMKNRGELEISGVTDVGAFDEESVTMSTEMGDLNVRGTGLHITNLDLDSSNICITGKIVAVFYTENKRSGGSIINRLFK